MHDYAFVAPDEIEAGLTTFIVENHGVEPHHTQLIRLNDGVTLEEFFATLESEGEAAFFMLATAEGGAGALGHEGKQEITLNLIGGQYLLACFIAGEDGIPHLVKGMVKPFQVVSADGDPPAPEPQADLTVTMDDFSFDLPSEVNAGRQVWKVINQGKQWHEMNLIRLQPGKTIQDVGQFMEAPDGLPPFEMVGGVNGFSSQGVGWLILDLEPGDYVALCFIPDPATGHSHLELGMVSLFTAQ
jgi:hypothetical protein